MAATAAETDIPDVVAAVRALADLSQPVSLLQEGGGYTVLTCKGQNRLKNVLHSSVDNTIKYGEELLAFLDSQVSNEEKFSDEIVQDMHASPPWTGVFPHSQAVYFINDLSPYLMPNRSILLDGALEMMGVEDSGPIAVLRSFLDRTCSMGDSCAYRHLYPHVNSAGPIALNLNVMDTLQSMYSSAAGKGAFMQSCLDVLIDVTASQPDESHQSQHRDEWCICCILVSQTRAYFTTENVATSVDVSSGLLKHMTLIGVAKDPYNEPPTITSTVSFATDKPMYMADSLPFADYTIVREDSQWIVKRKQT